MPSYADPGIITRHMWQYLLSNAFKFSVRIGVLLAADASLCHIIRENLGYRMDFNLMFLSSLIAITAMRLWMPWSDKD